jgi:hypothetical protein
MFAGPDQERREATYKRVSIAFETLVALHHAGQVELHASDESNDDRFDHLRKYLETCREWNIAYRIYLDATQELGELIFPRKY